VRKIASGVGVEKIYPLYSPLIEKIEIVKRAKVRRAKLYYIREKVAREIKRQMRRMSLVSFATEGETEAAARIEAEGKAAEEAAQAAEAEAVVTTDATSEVAAAETAEEVPTTPGEDEKAEVLEEKFEETDPAETPAEGGSEDTKKA